MTCMIILLTSCRQTAFLLQHHRLELHLNEGQDMLSSVLTFEMVISRTIEHILICEVSP